MCAKLTSRCCGLEAVLKTNGLLHERRILDACCISIALGLGKEHFERHDEVNIFLVDFQYVAAVGFSAALFEGFLGLFPLVGGPG